MKTATIDQYHMLGTKSGHAVRLIYRGKVLMHLMGDASESARFFTATINRARELGFTHWTRADGMGGISAIVMPADDSIAHRVTVGYLECAEWADKPEGSNARFSQAAYPIARKRCELFIAACGPLFVQAIEIDGYSAERFGHDYWLTACGHGTGFWDRTELGCAPIESVSAIDRDGQTYDPRERAKDASLGDVLSGIAYGTGSNISRFSYTELQAYRGWLMFYPHPIDSTEHKGA